MKDLKNSDWCLKFIRINVKWTCLILQKQNCFDLSQFDDFVATIKLQLPAVFRISGYKKWVLKSHGVITKIALLLFSITSLIQTFQATFTKHEEIFLCGNE